MIGGSNRLITLGELAEFLGLARSTVYKHWQEYGIPHVKTERALRAFPRAGRGAAPGADRARAGRGRTVSDTVGVTVTPVYPDVRACVEGWHVPPMVSVAAFIMMR